MKRADPIILEEGSRRRGGVASTPTPQSSVSTRGGWPSPPPGLLLAGGSAVLWCIYTLVLTVATSGTLPSAAADALVSVSTCAGLSVIVHSFLKHGVMPRPVQVQVIAHTALAPAFAVTWYSVIVIVFAFIRGMEGFGFQITAFSRPAFAWQIFQGLTLYGFVAAGLTTIHPSIHEAAVIDGANRIQRFFYITIPILRGHLFVVMLMVTNFTLQSAETIYSMTQGGPGYATETLGVRIFKTAFNDGQPNASAVLGVLMLVIALVLMTVYGRMLKPQEETVDD